MTKLESVFKIGGNEVEDTGKVIGPFRVFIYSDDDQHEEEAALYFVARNGEVAGSIGLEAVGGMESSAGIRFDFDGLKEIKG